MMRGQILDNIFNTLKGWLSRLALRSISVLLSFLSLFRRFAAGHSKPRDRGSMTRTHSQCDVPQDDAPIYPNLLPSDKTSLEVSGDPSSPSDDPYSRTRSQSNLRQGTEMSVLEAHTTTETCSSAAGSNPSLSVSSLHSSRQSQSPPPSPRIPYDMKGKGITLQSSTSPSPHVGLHELIPGSQWRTSSMNSRDSVTGRSSAHSLAASESRRSEYRKHVGPVHSFVHSSLADLHHGSINRISVPLGLPVQAVPISDTGIDPNFHLIIPPGDDGEPGSEVVTLYDPPKIEAFVPDDIKRYDRATR